MGHAPNKLRKLERDESIIAGIESQLASERALAERAALLGRDRCACGTTWHQGRVWAVEEGWRQTRLYCCLCLPDELVGVVGPPDSYHLPGMCNLYAVTKSQQAIREAARAMQDRLGNLPPLPSIFPDAMAPIVRGNGADREMVMGRWGFPPPPARPGAKASTRPVTNVRNTQSRHWTPWLKKPEHRCLVPVTSFSEPDNRAGDDKPSVWTWFAADESRPVMFFAGIWRDWEGVRGTKAHSVAGKHLLYSFLTTEASPDVASIHPDATPVLLLTHDQQETWLNAPWEMAQKLQVPPRAGALRIVATATKSDG